MSFKNRWKLIKEELLEERGKRVYVEKKINKIIKERYSDGKIKTDGSYVYQKMNKLVDKRIYLPVRNIGCYAHEQGFVNIFELHKRLEDIIRIYHLSQRNSSVYTNKEKKYMEEFLRSRKIIEDRGLYVSF